MDLSNRFRHGNAAKGAGHQLSLFLTVIGAQLRFGHLNAARTLYSTGKRVATSRTIVPSVLKRGWQTVRHLAYTWWFYQPSWLYYHNTGMSFATPLKHGDDGVVRSHPRIYLYSYTIAFFFAFVWPSATRPKSNSYFRFQESVPFFLAPGTGDLVCDQAIPENGGRDVNTILPGKFDWSFFFRCNPLN